MAIDWDAVVSNPESEIDRGGLDERDEPRLDEEPPELTSPADD